MNPKWQQHAGSLIKPLFLTAVLLPTGCATDQLLKQPAPAQAPAGTTVAALPTGNAQPAAPLPRQRGTDPGRAQRQAVPAVRQGGPAAARTEYASPDTPLEVDDGPRRFVLAIHRAGDPKTFDDSQLRLGLANTRVDTEMLQLNNAVQQLKVLQCSYQKSPAPDGFAPNSIQVWLNKRPDLNGLLPNNQLQYRMSDVAINRCPQTWGEALKIAWGPTAWADLQAFWNKQALAREESRRQGEAAEAAKQKQRHADWINAASKAGALAPAQEAATLKSIESKINAFENAGNGLTLLAFRQEVEGPLGEAITRVAQSAWVRGRQLNAAGAGRAAYDSWDQNLGGRIVNATQRIEAVRYRQENRRMTLAEIQEGNTAIKRQGDWGNGANMMAVGMAEDELVDLMKQKLKGQNLIPASFLQRASKDLARDRPRGDPGRALYVYQPAEKKPNWSLTPEEQAAQDSAVGKVMDLAGLVGTMMRTLDKLDADARESRLRLWRCVASNCAEAGQALYAYSYAQTAKDHFFFLRNLNPAMRALAPGMAVLGDTNIDGGLIWGCNAERSAFETAIQTHLKQHPNTSLAPVLDGSAYQDWQACRDKMEFFLRPRSL